MANSGTIFTNAIDNQRYTVAVYWSISSQSTTNNTSTIYYKIYADNSKGSSYWARYYNTSVSINGQNVYSQGSRMTMYKGDVFKTGYITIPHNDDGSKSINISINSGITTSAINARASQTVYLDSIKRGINNVNLEGFRDITGTKTITFTKLNSSIVVKGYWQYWDNRNNVFSEKYYFQDKYGDNITGEYTSGKEFKFSQSVINRIHRLKPNNTETTINIILEAYLYGEKIQVYEKELDVYLTLENPNLSADIYFTGNSQWRLNSRTKGLYGVHDLIIDITATGRNNSKINSYEVTFEGVTYTNKYTRITPKSSGTKTISIAITDSRGQRSTTSRSVEVLPYESVKIKNHRSFRTSGGYENPAGENGRVVADIITYSISGVYNPAWWKISFDNSEKSGSTVLYNKWGIPFEEESRYTLEFGDRFSSSKVEGMIPSANAPLVIGKKSVGVGTIPPKSSTGLYVGGNKLEDKTIHIVDKNVHHLIKAETGSSVGNGEYMVLGQPNQYGLGIFSDGSLWLVRVNDGIRLRKISEGR